MKVVVRHQKTQRYLKVPLFWVENAAEATSFSRATEALGFCMRYRVNHAEVVLKLHRRDAVLSNTEGRS